jgi:hypothetical protein
MTFELTPHALRAMMSGATVEKPIVQVSEIRRETLLPQGCVARICAMRAPCVAESPKMHLQQLVPVRHAHFLRAMQILDVKKIATPGADRYRLILSDGSNFITAMLSQTANPVSRLEPRARATIDCLFASACSAQCNRLQQPGLPYHRLSPLMFTSWCSVWSAVKWRHSRWCNSPPSH